MLPCSMWMETTLKVAQFLIFCFSIFMFRADVVRAMHIAFKYREYFRKVWPHFKSFKTLLIANRILLLICLCIVDGTWPIDSFYYYLRLIKSSLGGMLSVVWLEEVLLISTAHSHNELDLPSITSPLMYEKISARKSVPQLYEEKLLVRASFSST